MCSLCRYDHEHEVVFDGGPEGMQLNGADIRVGLVGVTPILALEGSVRIVHDRIKLVHQAPERSLFS